MVFLDEPYSLSSIYGDDARRSQFYGNKAKWLETYTERKQQRKHALHSAKRREEVATAQIHAERRLKGGREGSARRNPQAPPPPTPTPNVPPSASGRDAMRGSSSMPALPPVGSSTLDGLFSPTSSPRAPAGTPGAQRFPSGRVIELKAAKRSPRTEAWNNPHPAAQASLITMAPTWWERRGEVQPAADTWDSNHDTVAARSQRVHAALQRSPADIYLQPGFRRVHESLFRHRFIPPELKPRVVRPSRSLSSVAQPPYMRRRHTDLDLDEILRSEGYEVESDRDARGDVVGSRGYSRANTTWRGDGDDADDGYWSGDGGSGGGDGRGRGDGTASSHGGGSGRGSWGDGGGRGGRGGPHDDGDGNGWRGDGDDFDGGPGNGGGGGPRHGRGTLGDGGDGGDGGGGGGRSGRREQDGGDGGDGGGGSGGGGDGGDGRSRGRGRGGGDGGGGDGDGGDGRSRGRGRSDGAGSGVQIYVEMPDNKTISLSVAPSDKISRVKAKVEDMEGIPAERQRLVLRGEQLEDGRTISDYGTQQGDTFLLVDGDDLDGFGKGGGSGGGDGNGGTGGGLKGFGKFKVGEVVAKLDTAGGLGFAGIAATKLSGGGKVGKKGKKAKGAKGAKGGGGGGLKGAWTGGDGGNGLGGGVTAGGWSAGKVLTAQELDEQLKGDGDFAPANSMCWAPRVAWCDAHALVDTEETERDRFDNDWRRVSVDLGVGRAIKSASGGGGGRGADPTDELEDPRVDEVKVELWKHRAAYAVVFDYYAAVGASGGGSFDLSFLSLNLWNQFLIDFSIINQKSKFLKQSDLDTLFITIDSHAARVQQEHLKEEEDKRQSSAMANSKNRATFKSADSAGAPANAPPVAKSVAVPKVEARFEDKKSKFSRVEFLAALVKIAIRKYVDTKVMTDVAQAVARFLESVIIPNLRPAHAPANNFRLAHLYSQDVEEVLRARLPSLRNIFNGLASRHPMLRKHHLVSLTHWTAFLRAAKMCDVDASERDAALCFAWSRMCVVNEITEVGNLRQENLPFEGFLEALVRFAHIKAMPFDEEVAAAKVPTAAHWLEDFKMRDVEGFNKFLHDRMCPWGAERRGRLHQPLHRNLHHLLDVVMRAVLKGDDGLEEVSQTTMMRWMERELDKDQSGAKKG